MGAWFSKREHIKSPSELQAELEQLNEQMAQLEAREAALERARRRWVMLLLVLAFVGACVFALYWAVAVTPRDAAAYALLLAPCAALLVLVLLARRGINAAYRFFIARVRRQRDELKETGKRELDEHLKAIDFEKTQRLLMQYTSRFSDAKPNEPSTPVQRKTVAQQPVAPNTAPSKVGNAGAGRGAPVAQPRTPQAARPQPTPSQQQQLQQQQYEQQQFLLQQQHQQMLLQQQQQQQQQQQPLHAPYMPPVPQRVPRPVSATAAGPQTPARPTSMVDRTVAWLVGDDNNDEVTPTATPVRAQTSAVEATATTTTATTATTATATTEATATATTTTTEPEVTSAVPSNNSPTKLAETTKDD
jgi:membrane protein implicated in regulation of membrane protease activity